MTLEKKYPDVLKKLINIVKKSSQLHAQDVGFQRTLDANFKAASQAASSQLLELVEQILAKSGTQHGSRKLQLEGVADVHKNWPAIQNAFDYFLDKTKAAAASQGSADVGPNVSDAGTAASPADPKGRVQATPEPVNFYDKSIAKPQTAFNPPIDNSYGPFRPHLASKPWATVPLNESLLEQPQDSSHNDPWFKQPYESEIMAASYPAFIYAEDHSIAKPDAVKMNDSRVTFVDTEKKLRKMISHLSSQQQIAVDLEHHDYRTYLGLTCLMQISSPTRDFIVDPLALWGEMQALNEVFCNPDILKVFHGARFDIVWLQRDLGLYIVNMFDTFFASKELHLAKHSLAFLLQHYCQFTADKKYQLADWRKRPLSSEMLDYARADTHFLLYIAQEMRNELLKAGKIEAVLQNSRETAATRFENPDYNGKEAPWTNIAIKFRLNVNDHVLEALYKWRDALARDLDESPRYIMSNSTLVALMQRKPVTSGGVLAVVTKPTPILREKASEIAEIIDSAAKLTPRAPEFPTRRNGRGPSPSAELFNALEINAAVGRRLKQGTIFDHKNREAGIEAKGVNLEVVQLSETNGGGNEAEEQAAIEPEASAAPTSPEIIEISDEEPEPVRPSSNKRRLHIVEDIDDFEHKQSAPKKRKSQEPVEAFDFSAAEPVMKAPAKDKKKKQQKTEIKGPRGARQKQAKNAGKTITYRR